MTWGKSCGPRLAGVGGAASPPGMLRAGAGTGAAEGAWAVGGGASAWAGLAAAARSMPWGLRAWGSGTGTREPRGHAGGGCPEAVGDRQASPNQGVPGARRAWARNGSHLLPP
jgi:hypothetical protein